MAELMGNKGMPVHRAVALALRGNRRYELVLCGHSLGAGVATLLALASLHLNKPAHLLMIANRCGPIQQRA